VSWRNAHCDTAGLLVARETNSLRYVLLERLSLKSRTVIEGEV